MWARRREMLLNTWTPMLKLLEARSAPPASRTAFSTSARRSAHPVEPHTTGTPLDAARIMLAGAVEGVVNSMAGGFSRGEFLRVKAVGIAGINHRHDLVAALKSDALDGVTHFTISYNSYSHNTAKLTKICQTIGDVPLRLTTIINNFLIVFMTKFCRAWWIVCIGTGAACQ